MNHIILPGLIIPEIIIIIDDIQIIIPEFIIPEEIIYIPEISIKKSTIEMVTYYDSDEEFDILLNSNIDVSSVFIKDDYFNEKKGPSYLFKPTRNIVRDGYDIFLY